MGFQLRSGPFLGGLPYPGCSKGDGSSGQAVTGRCMGTTTFLPGGARLETVEGLPMWCSLPPCGWLTAFILTPLGFGQNLFLALAI